MINVAVIFCPPLSEFPNGPGKDISPSTLIDCPTCSQPMWLSEKKKAFKLLMEKHKREIIMECYICFIERIDGDPSLIDDHIAVNI